MEKIMKIDGMSCEHCSARIEKALNALEGVTAKVDLDSATASITIDGTIAEQALRDAVTDAGYEVVSIR